MRRFSLFAFLVLTTPAAAQTPDPLRALPPIAELVLKIEKPRELVESIFKLQAYKEGRKLGISSQIFDNPDIRKFVELVQHFEKEMGMPWPDLVDGVAGGGAALGLKYLDGGKASPPVLVVQAKDEALLKKFITKALEVLKQELERGESKDAIQTKTVDGFEGIRVGNDLYIVRDGTLLFVAPKKEIAELMIEHLKKVKADPKTASMADHKGPAAAKAILPKDPLAWVWLDTAWTKNLDGAKELFEQPRNEVVQTVLFAGWLDVFHRADFLAAAITHPADGFELSIRMPAGLDKRAPDTVLHLPKGDAKDSLMPVLRPKNMLFTHSFYLDLGAVITDRTKIFPEKVAKDLADGDKQLSKVLPGASLEKFLTSTGPHHQFVVSQPEKLPYAKEPGQKIPTAAFLLGLKNKEAGPSFETLVRAGGFLASTQAPLKMSEETYKDVKLLIYKFDEKKPFEIDVDNIRFNFAPTFAYLDDRAIFAATPDLCKELIDLAKAPPTKEAAKGYENLRTEINAEGIAALVNADPQAVITQLILANAMGEAQAKKEAAALVDFIRNLGQVRGRVVYTANAWEMNWKWSVK